MEPMPPHNFKALLRHLFAFWPVRDSLDETWQFFTPSPGRRGRWLLQSFTKYRDTIYWSINLDMQLEYDIKKRSLAETQPPSLHSDGHYEVPAVIGSCIKTLKKAGRDWVGHHRWLLRTLSKQYRFGLVQRRFLWEFLPDINRPELKLTKEKYDHLMKVFDEQERPSIDLAIPPPSLQTYLEYCRVAYLANAGEYRIRKGMSGMEMYKALADGRDEGLTEIPPDSPEALTKWYRSGRSGGHPWEICRGGNTTHIDLGVICENEKWHIFLNGNSSGRMLETARMALAFHAKKMPFRWFNSKDVRLKMEGDDNIGIIPEHYTLHRANQLFDSHYEVFDCLYLRDLGKAKRQIEKFVIYLPLAPLYPRRAFRGS